ncbi:MAG: nucleotidyltransferase family protein [Nanoarchaeota archaeon]|nr:nucleotidyltransferase family protein [Nanoarchaeota archaeon]MBU4351525.1 nucleotidyltransferase family protein [Nanoarchaeota archaeon]MBU4456209.1 nucleotidyltransferase family protein [Nanoarchaeota archaeon]MCG2719156.1 nucleotidyltransferase family protein [Nanoarchaeota archaeon]
MKERATFTIESSILDKIDTTIDGYKIKNRSHAVELLLMRALRDKSLNKALILAGGKGERLKPITNEMPKPMVPLQGKPILQHAIDLMKRHGIAEIYLSIGYKGDKIKEYFGDGSRFGVKIIYIEENEPLGTAGPLRLAKKYLTETFVMCNADELKNIDLMDMFLFHKEKNAKATIALTTVPDPSLYGVAKLQGNWIMEFLEKPQNPPSNLINAGLYILEPEVIDMVPEGFAMIEKQIFPKIAAEKNLLGYSFTGQWMDTGTMERYARAQEEWKGL